jgi:16S rRNA C967 or C1407 C5-methylase (RsmB/RsmF family)
MEKPPLWQMKIATTKSKREYLQLMEEICERQAMQLEGRELDIQIKEMHAHMRGTELKEEEEEEELRNVKKLSRSGKKNLRYMNESLRNERRSLARLSIALSSSVMDAALYVLL